MTSVRSTPRPAWNNPRRRATGKPHPGRCSVGWPQAACTVGGLGPGASRAIDEQGAMALPPPFVSGGSLPRTAEALEPQVKEAPWEFGTSLTVSRCTEPQARQMGQMTAGGIAGQHLSEE